MKLDAEIRRVMEAAYGERAAFSYRAFDALNEKLWQGRLPTPLLLWEITGHSRCLAQTSMPINEDRPPIIHLHPSLLGGKEISDPWGIAPELLGRRWAADVVLHELMHVAIHRLYPPTERRGSSSHNNPAWCAEVNRIAPLIGLRGFEAGRSTTKRVQESGRSVVRRAHTGHGVSYGAVTRFPHGVREELGLDDYYKSRRTPPWM